MCWPLRLPAFKIAVQEGQTYTIPQGYHNGSGTVRGVAGGGNYQLQAKSVTPTKNEQSVTPDEGKGICKKVLILMLVGVANILDVHVVGQGSALRGAVIAFYLSNEGLSLLENAAYIGLPIPEKLREILAQLHNRDEKNDHGDGE